jgi:soluble lytic murein transglycosylase-like protein
MTWIREVRALCERAQRSAESLVADIRKSAAGARRSTVQLAVGLSLMVPAGFMMAAGRYDEIRTTAELEEFAEAVADDPAVTAAWREKLLERERSYLTAGFAQRFNIDVNLAEQIQTAAAEFEIEPDVAFGLVRAESTFRTRAVSPAGAIGLTQLMPATARWLQPGVTRAELMTPETNLRLGFRYLRQLIDQYDGDLRLALTAYNRGQGRVDRDLRAGRNPDNGYATAVRTGHVSRTLIRQNSPRG